MKFNLGFSRFRLRGLGKAGGEWTLVCLMRNIKKIYAEIMTQGGELQGLTKELHAGSIIPLKEVGYSSDPNEGTEAGRRGVRRKCFLPVTIEGGAING